MDTCNFGHLNLAQIPEHCSMPNISISIAIAQAQVQEETWMVIHVYVVVV